MQLRASVNQLLYPLSKPDTYALGRIPQKVVLTIRLLSSRFICWSSSNHKQFIKKLRRKLSWPERSRSFLGLKLTSAIFELVNEKYEANLKELLPFRVPIKEELTINKVLPNPVHQDPKALLKPNPPRPVESYDKGLESLTQISKDWETFTASQVDIRCERHSDTEFLVSLLRIVLNRR